MSAQQDEFRDYCIELFSSLTPHAGLAGIAARRMFGGTGFSIDGMTFAIIAMDQLWLKADEESRGEFERAGCQIFTYEADGKLRSMGYYTVPADAMESATLMAPWAAHAWGAALRAAAQKSRRSAKSAKSVDSTNSTESAKNAKGSAKKTKSK